MRRTSRARTPVTEASPDPGEVVLEAASPGYATTPPLVRDAGLIPAAVQAMMAPTLAIRHYPAGSVRVRRFRDVYVVGEGVLFDGALRLVACSRTQHTAGEVAFQRDRLAAALAAGPLAQDSGTTLLCQKRGMDNYGHWLIELLPMAYLVLDRLRRGEWSVLAPLGPMHAVVAEGLARLGVPAAQVRFADGTPRHLDEALVVDGLTMHGVTVSPLVMAAMDALAAGVAAGPDERIWVDRTGRNRTLWHGRAVAAILAESGWRVIRPETMTLTEQIAAFKGARHIAGVAGAGLTNLVFAAPGARVTAFMPAEMPDTFFWLLCNLRGHAYKEVRSRQGDGAYPARWEAALVLDVAEVLAELTEP